jgi:cell shape-determining protein MreC
MLNRSLLLVLAVSVAIQVHMTQATDDVNSIHKKINNHVRRRVQQSIEKILMNEEIKHRLQFEFSMSMST